MIMAKYPKYKVAAVQAAPVYLDLKGTVEKYCQSERFGTSACACRKG